MLNMLKLLSFIKKKKRKEKKGGCYGCLCYIFEVIFWVCCKGLRGWDWIIFIL